MTSPPAATRNVLRRFRTLWILLAALAPVGLALGMPTTLSPCPPAQAFPEVALPPRVGTFGAIPPDSQDSSVFDAPIGPGQTTRVRINMTIQFFHTTTVAPSIEYKLLHVRGTQPSTAVLQCESTPLLSGTVAPDRVGITTKSVVATHLLSAFNTTDEQYPLLDFVVWTRGNAFVDWKITLEPCGYPCLEPVLFPGPCDPFNDLEACL